MEENRDCRMAHTPQKKLDAWWTRKEHVQYNTSSPEERQQQHVTDMQSSCTLLKIRLNLQKHASSCPLQAGHSGGRSLQRGKHSGLETTNSMTDSLLPCSQSITLIWGWNVFQKCMNLDYGRTSPEDPIKHNTMTEW